MKPTTKLIAAVLAALVLLATRAFAADVGFEEVRIPNGPDAPLAVGIWYPTRASATPHSLGSGTQLVAPDAPVAGRRLPLIVLSHGGGGWYGSHYDTARALARAGFVAAAVSHAGDTFDDQRHVLELWRRPAQLHRLIDYMLDEWPQREHLSATRVGAFGFSNGGFTVLVAAGGVPNLGAVLPFCAAHAEQDLCQALKHAGVDALPNAYASRGIWIADPRIRAAVIAAPAFGFAFGRAGLGKVLVPVQLWRAADDRHQPSPWYDDAVRDDLPRAPEFHVIANAGHYDFLPPCDARLSLRAPAICASEPGFDRAAFHEQFNNAVVRFFRETLP
jgi:predicted dienelactone hydrolase